MRAVARKARGREAVRLFGCWAVWLFGLDARMRGHGTGARAEGAEGGLKVVSLLAVFLQRRLQLAALPLWMSQVSLQAQVEQVVAREVCYPLLQPCFPRHAHRARIRMHMMHTRVNTRTHLWQAKAVS